MSNKETIIEYVNETMDCFVEDISLHLHRHEQVTGKRFHTSFINKLMNAGAECLVDALDRHRMETK